MDGFDPPRLLFPGSIRDSSRARRHQHEIRSVRLAVCLVAELSLSFRNVSAVLSLLLSQDAGKAPSPGTARRWLLRLALARLRRTCRPEPGGWTLLIDHTLGQGTRKCFVVLGIPTRDLLARSDHRLALRDMFVLAIELMDGSNGEKVDTVLRGLAPRLGQINQVVCDHGGDLLNGLARLRQDHPGIVTTYDARHLLAGLLKRQLKDCPRWAAFLAECGKAMPKLRQTAGNFLAPPVLRVKARWMNLAPHIGWAMRLSAWRRKEDWEGLAAASGTKAKEAKRWFGEVFGWLEGFDEDVRGWSELLEASQMALSLVQEEGLRWQTAGRFGMLWRESQQGVGRRLATERFAQEVKRLLANEGAKVGKNQVALGSSDAVESLFGKFKEAMARGPEKTLGASVLLMALMAGPPLGNEEAKIGLEETGTDELLRGVQENLGKSDRAKKRQFLGRDPSGKPKPPFDPVPA